MTNATPDDSVCDVILLPHDPIPPLDPSPLGLIEQSVSTRESGIAKLVAGQPLTEEEAKAVAGG